MKEKIDQLQCRIASTMQTRLAEKQFESVSQLSKLLSAVGEIGKKYSDLERALEETTASLGLITTKHVGQQGNGATAQSSLLGASFWERAQSGGLRIRVRWSLNRRNLEDEEFCEHTAAATMAVFVGRLVTVFGETALKKLLRIRINRGPLLSQHPEVDFINQTQQSVYAHKKVPGTDYFILTHSQTSQKVEDLKRVCRILELVPGSVQIEAVPKCDALSAELLRD